MSVTLPDPFPPTGVVGPPYGMPPCDCSNPDTFRSHYPEFGTTATYPDPQVQAMLNVGGVMCSWQIWRDLRPYGVELIAAHLLALSRYAQLGGTAGVPGLARGIMNSKSVSKVSVGYDVGSTAIEGAGPWNLTIYGQQYAFYWRIVGAAPFEALAIGWQAEVAGIVMTWQRGVMLGHNVGMLPFA